MSSFIDERDGQSYATVIIGSQTWMAENLNYEATNSWLPNNDSAMGALYGRLYTWESALNSCPEGWHLPSDEEWKTLEKHLGMSQASADSLSIRGTDQGTKLKSESGWIYGGNGTNQSGFNALPAGGYFQYGSTFLSIQYSGYWWTSTSFDETSALYRELLFLSPDINRFFYTKTDAFSVRCIKD